MEFYLNANCDGIECPAFPGLHGLRTRIPVNKGDFALGIDAVARGDKNQPCPYAPSGGQDESVVTANNLLGRTPASVLFGISCWGYLVFTWNRAGGKVSPQKDTTWVYRPRVYCMLDDTATGADVRDVLAHSLLPDIRALTLDDTAAAFCAPRSEFEDTVTQDMLALAEYIDANGGTFGVTVLPGAHDPITDAVQCFDDGGSESEAVFGTANMWYAISCATS